jgi:hypothetical protein
MDCLFVVTLRELRSVITSVTLTIYRSCLALWTMLRRPCVRFATHLEEGCSSTANGKGMVMSHAVWNNLGDRGSAWDMTIPLPALP